MEKGLLMSEKPPPFLLIQFPLFSISLPVVGLRYAPHIRVTLGTEKDKKQE
jgi:hypothetical protein